MSAPPHTLPSRPPSGRSLIVAYLLVILVFLAMIAISYPIATFTLFATGFVAYALIRNVRVIIDALRVEATR